MYRCLILNLNKKFNSMSHGRIIMNKFKKLLCVLLVICALVPLFPTTVFAASTIASGDCSKYYWEDNVSWKLDSNYTLTISGSGKMDNFLNESDIPWYSYRKQIKKVVVKDGVTEIGYYAFKNCVALTDVRIGNDVLEINSGAFEGCTALKKITIPDNVVTLGYSIFRNCTALKDVVIGDSIAEIDSSLFTNCIALKSITIPDSVISIGSYEFDDCHNLETVFYGGTKAQRNSMVIANNGNDNLLEYAAWHYKAGAGEHSNKTTSITAKATTSANGKKAVKCTVCGKKSSKTIYKISSVELSSTAYTYNGSKRTPSVTVKDSKGNKLVKGEDYKVTYSSSKRTAVGRYSVKVTFMGEYKGTKTLYYTIGPKNPSSVKAKLYGYDDVKVTWKKVSGATGYRVSYKTSTSSTWKHKTTTATSIKLADLSDGVKYNIKVSAYKTVNGNKCFSNGKTVNITTLKKINGIKVVKSGENVKVSWNNIAGETGYQISRSTSKTGTNIVSTYGTTSGNYKNVSATEGKTYYYKVRAYKVVDGNKIYGPWSNSVEYCNEITSARKLLGNYVKNYGEQLSSGVYYVSDSDVSGNNTYTTFIYYNPSSQDIRFAYHIESSYGTTLLGLYYQEGASKQNIMIEETLSDGYKINGSGYIYTSLYALGDSVYSFTCDQSAYTSQMKSLAESGLDLMFFALSDIFEESGTGVTLESLGFEELWI